MRNVSKILKGITGAIRRAAGRPVPAQGTGTDTPAQPTRRPRIFTRGPAARSRRGPTPAPPPAGNTLHYSPNLDGDADPGEIVWTWVEYEDDPTQGKDRPVLVVGRNGRRLLGLMLSSQSDRNGQRHWLALGEGTWDKDKRPSWIRLDRVLDIDEDGIRREGAILDRPRFDRVAAILRRNYGWK